MSETTDRHCSLHTRRWDIFLIAALFFIGCFLYLFLAVEPGLVYFSFGDLVDFPEFSFDYSFFAERVSAPGGTAGYAGDFLSQWFYYPAAATMIIMAVAFAFWLLTFLMITTVGGVRSRLASFLPALWVVMLWGDYDHQLEPLLALLVSAAFAVAYMKLPIASASLRVAVFAAMFVFLYYAAAGASLVFAILAAIYELFAARPIAAVLIAAVAAAGAYLLGTCVFFLQMPRPYLHLLVLSPLGMNLRTVSLLYMYLFLPVLMVFFGLRRKLSGPPAVSHDGKPRTIHSSLWLKPGVTAAILAGLSIGGLYFSFDANRKNLLVMNSFLRQGRWREFLVAAGEFEKLDAYDVRINYDINRALFHTGRLGDEMFFHKQGGNGLFLSGRENFGFLAQYLRMTDISYELGDVNAAEHLAYEILEMEGVSPGILRRLADINLVKGQIPAARVFLKALCKDLIHGSYARRRLSLLQTDPELKTDKTIQHLRSCRLLADKAPPQSNPEQLLLDLLEANPNNPMALEYLMAVYLLTHNLDKLVANLHRLDDVGYDRIPRHWEEAILVYGSRRKEVNLYGRKISRQTQERFAKFLKIRARYRSNMKAPRAALADEFGNTYFFYRMFNMPPMIQDGNNMSR